MSFLQKIYANKLTFGYNSYSDKWTSIRKLKTLEIEDRGNEWFDDSKLDLDKTLGIWVTENPIDALFYMYSPELRNLVSDYDTLPSSLPRDYKHLDKEEYKGFLKAIKNPEQEVTKVVLKDAVPVITHSEEFGDSYLYIKPVYKK